MIVQKGHQVLLFILKSPPRLVMQTEQEEYREEHSKT